MKLQFAVLSNTRVCKRFDWNMLDLYYRITPGSSCCFKGSSQY